jgi:hypothetical protein
MSILQVTAFWAEATVVAARSTKSCDVCFASVGLSSRMYRKYVKYMLSPRISSQPGI